MAESFLDDRAFLLKLNKNKVREYLAEIIVLDFSTEKPIASLIGKVLSGSMSINAQSPTRRTGSLQVVFEDNTKNIKDTANLIAVDKKIRISVGYKNPFYHIDEYRRYGEDLFFPQGIFIVTGASSSITTTSCTVTMQFTDKMALLNGTAGGSLPASVSFHESIIVDKDENQTTEYPLIKDIVREAVNHFGGEQYSKIIADDIPEKGRQVVSWNSDTPIRFAPFDTGGASFIISNGYNKEYSQVYYRGEVVGYMETDLTYPGELVQKAGGSVQQVCDTIAKTLGNYEYFYDLEGNFRFQQIANYDKTGITPLMFSNDKDASNDTAMYALLHPNWNDDQYIDEFADKELILSINQNPQYANIKNDFVCWGTRQDKSNNSNNTNVTKMVRYHLAIDKKPREGETDLCNKYIFKVYNVETLAVTKYVFKDKKEMIPINEENQEGDYDPKVENYESISSPLKYEEEYIDEEGKEQTRTVPFYDWREELYRRALNAYGSSQEGSYYDEELLAEWREIFDYDNEEFRDEWNDYFGEDTFRGYNPIVKNAPEKLRYWLDFIDSSAPIGQYSVDKIGRRTLAWEDSQINEVYAREINDVVFVINPGDPAEAQKAAEYYINQGQTYCFIRPEMESQFSYKNSYGTCFEAVRQKLNENLYYKSTVSLTCIPIFYLDVNKIIRLNYPELGVSGDYVINTISWQIGYNSTMSISCNEAITVI